MSIKVQDMNRNKETSIQMYLDFLQNSLEQNLEAMEILKSSMTKRSNCVQALKELGVSDDQIHAFIMEWTANNVERILG